MVKALAPVKGRADRPEDSGHDGGPRLGRLTQSWDDAGAGLVPRVNVDLTDLVALSRSSRVMSSE